MVQALEAWLLADPDAIEQHFGAKGFNRSALTVRSDVENIPKHDHVESLDLAVRDTPKGRYDKFRDCPAILERLRPELVRNKAPHCDRIFNSIRKLIDDATT